MYSFIEIIWYMWLKFLPWRYEYNALCESIKLHFVINACFMHRFELVLPIFLPSLIK